MGEVYDEIEIEDMDWNEDDKKFYFACPCGDMFQISLASPILLTSQKDLETEKDIATCPSCSLTIRVIYELEDLEEYYEEEGSEEEEIEKK
jgi:hypothetical protein